MGGHNGRLFCCQNRDLDGLFQTGTVNVTGLTVGIRKISVTFQTPFSSPPKVFLTANGGYPEPQGYISVDSISATGFTVAIQNKAENAEYPLIIQYLATAE